MYGPAISANTELDCIDSLTLNYQVMEQGPKESHMPAES